MVKHTQTICRRIADELFECVWPFCGIGVERDIMQNFFSTSNVIFPVSINYEWSFEYRKKKGRVAEKHRKRFWLLQNLKSKIWGTRKEDWKVLSVCFSNFECFVFLR